MPESVRADAVLTAVRVFTGLAMALAHGWGKVFGDPADNVARAARLGFPLPEVFGWAAAISEFAGGLLLAIGLFTRPAALFILCTMVVATYSHAVVRGDPFSAMEGGSYELACVFGVLCLQYLVIGSGRFGVDRLVRP